MATDISLFDFDLPEELIAQSPSPERDHSRLLVVNRANHTYEDKYFYDIVDYLHEGDVLVRNNTKVLPSRLLGIKEDTGAKIELLLLNQVEGEEDIWECLSKPAKSIKVGTIINFGEGKLIGECTKVLGEGIRHIKFTYEGIFMEVLEELGKMPLPPYIKKQLVGNDRYQTVYATVPGSAAAPTAGFHFTEELFDGIKEKGVIVVDITLRIGLGTFRPVKVQNVEDHVMHSEEYEITSEAAGIINLAKKEGRRIIAIGTTSVRTLEANYTKYGEITPTRESTDIFITPGYEYKVIDALITNFHLPKSTLIMLVSAFAGREFTLECYKHAVEEKYRFFSFGDACFFI
ncbi:MAG: tRNA preQ1(34) S-adenosylmethionine ribosyltransferase-isomerase QueA [Coprobacillus sp.]|nr:tRNA preQ1(34) S-adenosylmethionine ribosyltransferase-isomerase QueA [Coprobacillus sp.]